jgi:CDP-diacylglycerol--glycerol-3-phosphate 3-phosphatidyltransferase
MMIRIISLVLCAVTALAAGTAHLFVAAASYVIAGVLEFFDRYDTSSRALFGSVSDRWGELVVFAGYAWLLHDSPWLFAVMGAATGSMMVSYTRARAEGLGAPTGGDATLGTERIVLLAAGSWVAAWFEDHAVVIVGVTMAIYGLAAAITAIRRGFGAYRRLRALDAANAAGTTTTATATQASSPMIASTPNEDKARLAAGTRDA